MPLLATATPTGRKTSARVLARQQAELKTPAGFIRGALGHSLWEKQREIANDVATQRRVAVKSCNASGKTFLAADLTLWWVTTYSDGIVVTTAPTWTQVDQLLWGEIRKTVADPATKIKYGDINQTEIKLGPKNYAIGISTNQSARFSGFHAGRVLILMDEAEGILPQVWEAINGLRAGGHVVQLAIGNPLIVGGEYYDIFTTHRAGWKTHTISAFDTPNLRYVSLTYLDEQGAEVTLGHGKNLLEMTEEELDYGPRSYLCGRRWLKEMFEEWGPNHPYFQSRVLGEFPTQGDDALIPLSWLEKLKLKDAKHSPEDVVRAGLDVAGPGEAETFLWVMKGDHLVLGKGWPQADPRGEIVAALAPYKEELVSLNVDCIGVGWGIYLHLADIFDRSSPGGGKKKVVNAVNVGAPARDDKKFANSKAEYFWNLRMRAQAGELLGLTDEKTIGQLAVIKYRQNSRGKIEIESKDELKKRGVKSPDRAEALMLCDARPKKVYAGFDLSVSGDGAGGDDDLVRPGGFRSSSTKGTRWAEED
jgi:phage terminase large subunit